MRLFKVKIEGLGERYVPARGKAAALDAVKAEIIQALVFKVEPSAPAVDKLWKAATHRGPRSQRRLLQRLDTIIGPVDARRATRTIAKAKADLDYAERLQNYVTEVYATAAPLNPDSIRKIQQLVSASWRTRFEEWTD